MTNSRKIVWTSVEWWAHTEDDIELKVGGVPDPDSGAFRWKVGAGDNVIWGESETFEKAKRAAELIAEALTSAQAENPRLPQDRYTCL